MPKGFPKFLPEKVCLICDEKYQTTSSRQKYCYSCIRKDPWEKEQTDYRRRLSKLCSMAKNRAQNKNLNFNITKEYLWYLWEEQEGCCALTGQEFDLTKWGQKGQVNPRAPSVDRIKPNLGYVEGNVRLITYHMNIALSDFGTKEFETLIAAYKEVN